MKIFCVVEADQVPRYGHDLLWEMVRHLSLSDHNDCNCHPGESPWVFKTIEEARHFICVKQRPLHASPIRAKIVGADIALKGNTGPWAIICVDIELSANHEGTYNSTITAELYGNAGSGPLLEPEDNGGQAA